MIINNYSDLISFYVNLEGREDAIPQSTVGKLLWKHLSDGCEWLSEEDVEDLCPVTEETLEEMERQYVLKLANSKLALANFKEKALNEFKANSKAIYNKVFRHELKLMSKNWSFKETISATTSHTSGDGMRNVKTTSSVNVYFSGGERVSVEGSLTVKVNPFEKWVDECVSKFLETQNKDYLDNYLGSYQTVVLATTTTTDVGVGYNFEGRVDVSVGYNFEGRVDPKEVIIFLGAKTPESLVNLMPELRYLEFKAGDLSSYACVNVSGNKKKYAAQQRLKTKFEEDWSLLEKLLNS